MDRSTGLALASAGAGLLSFSTLLAPSEGPVAHLAENATWGFLGGAIVLALLAADGAKGRASVRALLGGALALAGLRAILVFVGF